MHSVARGGALRYCAAAGLSGCRNGTSFYRSFFCALDPPEGSYRGREQRDYSNVVPDELRDLTRTNNPEIGKTEGEPREGEEREKRGREEKGT